MKITSGNTGNIHNQSIEYAVKQSNSNKSSEAGKNIDTLTLSSGRKISDSQFVQLLKTRISKEVRQETDTNKLADLKQQVSLGEYDINPKDIVRKILCD